MDTLKAFEALRKFASKNGTGDQLERVLWAMWPQGSDVCGTLERRIKGKPPSMAVTINDKRGSVICGAVVFDVASQVWALHT